MCLSPIGHQGIQIPAKKWQFIMTKALIVYLPRKVQYMGTVGSRLRHSYSGPGQIHKLRGPERLPIRRHNEPGL